MSENILRSLGATDADMETLLEYTANAFSPRESGEDDDAFLEKWEPVLETARSHGAAKAVNLHLAKPELQVDFEAPDTLRLAIYPSVGGLIPVITTKSVADFEGMVQNIVRKGRADPNIGETGASFAFGKTNRFIILSDKPYSNVSAERMGLSDAEWREKSLIIRKNHECAHYYTKRHFGSARNNLHDELIADFAGLYAAFGTYRAEWFLTFLGLSGDPRGAGGRFKVYAKDLSPTAAEVITKLAVIAAAAVEEWTKSGTFAQMGETDRIRHLCVKDLLEYADENKGSVKYAMKNAVGSADLGTPKTP